MTETLKLVIMGEDQFSGVMGKLKSHLPSLKTLAIGAGAAIAGTGAALFAMAKSTAEAYDKVQKFSDQIGVSTSFLSKMNVAAGFADIQVETMNKSIERLQVGMGESARGIGMAKDAFKDLNISIYDANGNLKTSEEVMPELADAFGNLTNATQKTELAQKIFGQRGLEMLKLFKNGSAGLNEMTAEAEKFGLVVSAQAGANAAEFNDSLQRVGMSLQGLKNYISEQVIPIITGLANKFADFVANNRAQIIDWAEGFVSVLGQVAEYGAYAVGILIDSWRGLQMVWQVLKIALIELESIMIMSLEKTVNVIVAVMEKLNFRGIFDGAIEKAKGFGDAMRELGEITDEQVAGSWKKLNDIIDQGSATKKVKEAIIVVKEAFAEIQESGMAHVEAMGGTEGIHPFTTANIEKTQENIDLLKEIRLEQYDEEIAQLEELQQAYDDHFMTEGEKLQAWYDKKFAMFIGNNDAIYKLDKLYKAKAFDLHVKDVEARAKFDEQVQKERISAMNDFYNNIQYLGQHNGRTMFKIAKAAAIGHTIMQTYEGAQKAYTSLAGIPIIGPALGTMAAIAAIAAGMARVSQIRSQEYSAAHGGLGYVPKEQTYLLDRGERILSPNQNRDLADFMKKGTTASIENLNLNVSITGKQLQDMTTSDVKDLVLDKFMPALQQLKEHGIYA